MRARDARASAVVSVSGGARSRRLGEAMVSFCTCYYMVGRYVV